MAVTELLEPPGGPRVEGRIADDLEPPEFELCEVEMLG